MLFFKTNFQFLTKNNNLNKIKFLRTFSKLKRSVTIVEVGPRDGLQYERVILPLEIKIELINRLSATGLTRIESGSFVNSKLVPQFSDTSELFASIKRVKHAKYSALVPNVKGLENAIKSKVDEIAIFGSSSEDFSKKNINCSIEDSFIRFKDVMSIAKSHHIPVRGYLSCVIGCPYSGSTDPNIVAELTRRMLDLGCFEVSLGDTIGIGMPDSISRMLEACLKLCDTSLLALHCHDTNGMAIANIGHAVDLGINVIDSSIAGLGGCPFAGPNASGNVSTEKVIDLLYQRDLLDETIDREKISEVAKWISDILMKKKMNL